MEFSSVAMLQSHNIRIPEVKHYQSSQRPLLLETLKGPAVKIHTNKLILVFPHQGICVEYMWPHLC